MRWVRPLGALFPRFLLCGSLPPASHSWPRSRLTPLQQVEWNRVSRACYFPPLPLGSHPTGKLHVLATILGTVQSTWRSRAHPTAGRVWRPSARVPGGAGLSNPGVHSWNVHFPQVYPSTNLISKERAPIFSSQLVQNSDRKELLFTPQIPATERDQTDIQEFLLSSKLWSVLQVSPTLSLCLWRSCLPLLTHR